MELLNIQTRRKEEVPDDQVNQSFAAGTHIPVDGHVLVSPDGRLGVVPKDKARNAIEQGNYSVPSQDQLNYFAKAEKYGRGIGNELGAAGAGALRGGTLGLSDLALTSSGAVSPETLQGLREFNPAASTAGEVGGAIAGTVLAPGVAPAGLVGKLGTGIAERVAPAAAEALGGSRAAIAAGKVMGQALGGGAEGALYGAGETVTEHSLGDPKLNAEKLLHNIGYSALLGGALGGALEAGVIGVPAVVGKVKTAVTKLRDWAVGAPGEEAGLGVKMYAAAKEASTGIPSETIIDAFKNRAVRALTKEEQDKVGGEFAEVLGDVHASATKMAKDVESQVKKITEEDIPKDIVPGVEDPLHVRQKAHTEAADEHVDATDLFRKYFTKKMKTEGGSYTYKVDPGKVTSYVKAVGTPRGALREEALKNYLDATNGLIDQTEQTFKEVAGGDFAGQAQEARDFLSAATDIHGQAIGRAEEGLPLKALKSHARREADLTKTSLGIGLGGAAAFHYAGPLAGGIATGVGIARSAYAALKSPYEAVQKLKNIEKMVTKTSKSIETGVGAVLRPVAAVGKTGRGVIAAEIDREKEEKNFQKRSKFVADRINAPGKILDEMDASTKSLYHVAPEISSQLQMNSLNALQFLNTKIPKQQSHLPFDREFKPTIPQMIKFNRYHSAVENPLKAFDEIKAGHLTNETLETLQTIYPGLYTEMKSTLLDKLVSKLGKGDRSLPYQRRIVIEKFLGSPLDSSSKPSNIASNQAMLSQSAQEKDNQEAATPNGVKPTQGGLGKIDIAGRNQTAMEKVSTREA